MSSFLGRTATSPCHTTRLSQIWNHGIPLNARLESRTHQNLGVKRLRKFTQALDLAPQHPRSWRALLFVALFAATVMGMDAEVHAVGEVHALRLPDGWFSAVDPASGNPYYWREDDQGQQVDITWDRPIVCSPRYFNLISITGEVTGYGDTIPFFKCTYLEKIDGAKKGSFNYKVEGGIAGHSFEFKITNGEFIAACMSRCSVGTTRSRVFNWNFKPDKSGNMHRVDTTSCSSWTVTNDSHKRAGKFQMTVYNSFLTDHLSGDS